MNQSIAHVALVVRDYDEAIDFYINKLQFRLVEDTYQPEQESEQLRMQAELNGTNLKILEPFFKRFFTGIEGTATGIIGITGRLNNPFIRGDGTIQDGRVHVGLVEERPAAIHYIRVGLGVLEQRFHDIGAR